MEAETQAPAKVRLSVEVNDEFSSVYETESEVPAGMDPLAHGFGRAQEIIRKGLALKPDAQGKCLIFPPHRIQSVTVEPLTP